MSLATDSAGDAPRRQASPDIADAYYARAKKLVEAATFLRGFDQPWLANRTRDGKSVIIDRRIPRILPKCGINTDLSLAWHELSEWLAMNAGLPYDQDSPDGHDGPTAHVDVATPLERREVERQKPGAWKEYTDEIDGYILEVDDEKIKHVAPDQDLRQFEEDDRALLRKLIAAEAKDAGPPDEPRDPHGQWTRGGSTTLLSRAIEHADKFGGARIDFASGVVLGIGSTPVRGGRRSRHSHQRYQFNVNGKTRSREQWLEAAERELASGTHMQASWQTHDTAATDASPTALDPTGTTALRQRFRRDMDARWAKLRALTTDAIAKSDILGLGGLSVASIQHVAHMPLSHGKVEAFQHWFAEGTRQAVLGGHGSWVASYIAEAYEMGVRRASKQVDGLIHPADDRASLLTSLTIAELNGVAATTTQQAVRAVAHGVAVRQRPEKIARAVADRIKAIGQTRGRAIVSYMVVKAFNAAILDTLRAAGVSHVHTIPEYVRGVRHTHDAALTDAPRKTPQQRHSGTGQFRTRGQFERKVPQKRHSKTGKFIAFTPTPSQYAIRKAEREYRKLQALREVDVVTAGDDRVCDVCDDIAANGPYAIDAAEGMIPAHPSCRCSFTPASPDE